MVPITADEATVYPKKYAHGFCFALLCCGYTLTDFPISIRPTSLALWQSNDCPSASKATLMNMDKYFMWIHYERLHNHNKAKHNKIVCIFIGIYCTLTYRSSPICWCSQAALYSPCDWPGRRCCRTRRSVEASVPPPLLPRHQSGYRSSPEGHSVSVMILFMYMYTQWMKWETGLGPFLSRLWLSHAMDPPGTCNELQGWI